MSKVTISVDGTTVGAEDYSALKYAAIRDICQEFATSEVNRRFSDAADSLFSDAIIGEWSDKNSTCFALLFGDGSIWFDSGAGDTNVNDYAYEDMEHFLSWHDQDGEGHFSEFEAWAKATTNRFASA